MTKQVIVPQDKLDKLEEARIKLYEFYEYYIKTTDLAPALYDLQNITGIMYELGNCNYPEYNPEHNSEHEEPNHD